MIFKRTVNNPSQFEENFTIEKEENNKKNGENNLKGKTLKVNKGKQRSIGMSVTENRAFASKFKIT